MAYSLKRFERTNLKDGKIVNFQNNNSFESQAKI